MTTTRTITLTVGDETIDFNADDLETAIHNVQVRNTLDRHDAVVELRDIYARALAHNSCMDTDDGVMLDAYMALAVQHLSVLAVTVTL